MFVFKNKQGISTDADPSLRIDSFAIINLRDVSTKLNRYIVFTMQRYKELITRSLKDIGNKILLFYLFMFYAKVLIRKAFDIHFVTNESDNKLILFERRFDVIFTSFSSSFKVRYD